MGVSVTPPTVSHLSRHLLTNQRWERFFGNLDSQVKGVKKFRQGEKLSGGMVLFSSRQGGLPRRGPKYFGSRVETFEGGGIFCSQFWDATFFFRKSVWCTSNRV